MKRALIRPETCRNCSPCAIEAQCEYRAIFRESPEQKPWVDFYHCSGCMKCKTRCPHKAVEEIAQPCTGGARAGW